MNNFPFEEETLESCVIRTFTQEIEDNDLVWHRDNENRIIEVIENIGWFFQYDNQIPFLLDGIIYVDKNKYHRVIKGSGILKIKVFKYSSI